MMKCKWDSLATTIVQSLARMVFSLLTGAHFFCLVPGFFKGKNHVACLLKTLDYKSRIASEKPSPPC